MTESREEAKTRLRGFVEEYVALCNKYEAEVLINSYGVHCVETDAGLSFAFKSVYPEWGEVVDERMEWDRDEEEAPKEGSFQGVDLAAPSTEDFTLIYMGDLGALEERLVLPQIPKELTPEEREIWKRENFHLLYGAQKSNIDQLTMQKTAQSGFTEIYTARVKQAIARAEGKEDEN